MPIYSLVSIILKQTFQFTKSNICAEKMYQTSSGFEPVTPRTWHEELNNLATSLSKT